MDVLSVPFLLKDPVLASINSSKILELIFGINKKLQRSLIIKKGVIKNPLPDHHPTKKLDPIVDHFSLLPQELQSIFV
jgi:hypothetical protein